MASSPNTKEADVIKERYILILFLPRGSSKEKRQHYYGNQLPNHTAGESSVDRGLVKKINQSTRECVPHPTVLLDVPLWTEGVEWLTPLGAVGELKQAGERAPVLTGVEENGVLKVDAVGEEVVVLIHPRKEIDRVGGKLRPISDFVM